MTVVPTQMRLLSTAIVLLALLSGSVMAQDPPPAKVEDVTAAVGKVFKSTEGGYTVVFPGDPKVNETTVNTALGPLKLNTAILGRGWAVFYVSFTDMPMTPETPAQKKASLDGSRDELIANGLRIISDSEVTVAGIDGREWLLEKDGAIMRARAFFVKNRLYQLIFTAQLALSFRNGKASPNPGDRTELFETSSMGFFDSFKLTN